MHPLILLQGVPLHGGASAWVEPLAWSLLGLSAAWVLVFASVAQTVLAKLATIKRLQRELAACQEREAKLRLEVETLRAGR